MENKLSFSQISVLFKCPQAWAHKYLYKTAPDYTDTDALVFGKAYHALLQSTNYTYKMETFNQDIQCIAMQHGLSNVVMCQLAACYMASCKDWERVQKELGKLTFVGTEVPIETEWLIGYIDNVVVNEEGQWWMVELKTASSQTAHERLVKEPQIGIYATEKEQVANKLGLDASKFAGVLYREVVKPLKKPQKDETCLDYALRVGYEIKIATWLIEPDTSYLATWLEHAKKEVMELRNGKEPLRVYGKGCYLWGKPCEYFSQCYGTGASDRVKRVGGEEEVTIL